MDHNFTEKPAEKLQKTVINPEILVGSNKGNERKLRERIVRNDIFTANGKLEGIKELDNGVEEGEAKIQRKG